MCAFFEERCNLRRLALVEQGGQRSKVVVPEWESCHVKRDLDPDFESQTSLASAGCLALDGETRYF